MLQVKFFYQFNSNYTTIYIYYFHIIDAMELKTITYQKKKKPLIHQVLCLKWLKKKHISLKSYIGLYDLKIIWVNILTF